MIEAKTNGNVSFWYADTGGLPPYRAPLPGGIDADVCIVGGGFTGLWTAYYLKQADPALRIVVVEKEFAGFGASGRNGGFLSGGFSWSRERYLETSSRRAVIDMEAAMRGTVEEVIRVAEVERIDADILRTDYLTVATNPAQLQRLRERYKASLDWEVATERIALLGRAETVARVRVKDAAGAFVTHGVARLQPAKLVRGLAAAVERLGDGERRVVEARVGRQDGHVEFLAGDLVEGEHRLECSDAAPGDDYLRSRASHVSIVVVRRPSHIGAFRTLPRADYGGLGPYA